jgi:hypothetical protein
MSDNTLSSDLLEGAGAIAEFLFGSSKKRRRVYWLLEEAKGPRPPIIRMGGTITARKSAIREWFAEQEARARGDKA